MKNERKEGKREGHIAILKTLQISPYIDSNK